MLLSTGDDRFAGAFYRPKRGAPKGGSAEIPLVGLVEVDVRQLGGPLELRNDPSQPSRLPAFLDPPRHQKTTRIPLGNH